MSVLKNKRNSSPYDYVEAFMKLYEYSDLKTSKVPSRKQRWLAAPIDDRMNEIYNLVMQSSNQYLNYGIKLKNEKEQAKIIIQQLISLQKPLIALWSIERYSTREMVHWCDLINETINMTLRMGGYEIPKGRQYMYILDYKAIQKMDFLKNMRELHRLIYTKMVSAPTHIRDSRGCLLMDLADDALYRLTEANHKIPRDLKQYEKRKEHIEIAMDDIRQMERIVIAVFSLMSYSNQIMIEWSKLVNDEITLLSGLKKSDESRFSDLK